MSGNCLLQDTLSGPPPLSPRSALDPSHNCTLSVADACIQCCLLGCEAVFSDLLHIATEFVVCFDCPSSSAHASEDISRHDALNYWFLSHFHARDLSNIEVSRQYFGT